MKIDELANSINGKIFGNDDFFSGQDFTGRFTLLNDAKKGDIVIRHWINGKGIEIASDKNIACIITQNPKDGAIETANELKFPLIITDKIELANAYALKWTVKKYSPDSVNIVITGTNGKSTTSHMIYHILNSAGYHVFTNTDSESEFNTLIDPMVSKLISDEVSANGDLDYLVIEVSEVQGWLGSLMKNHASKTWEDYSTKHLCKHLLASGDYQDAIACLNNSDLQHKRIFLVGQDTALRDYFFEIKALYCESFDYACSVFSTDPFISLFAMRRKFLYNSGLYFDLKECGFSDFLKTKSANWDINAEIGISYYYYITEDFNKTIDLVSIILSNKDYEEIMDYVMKEELLNLIGLCYRKHVDFVKSKENFMSAYKIGSEHNESYYLSTSLINLGKISYHELDWNSATEWNKKAFQALKTKSVTLKILIIRLHFYFF